MDEDVRNIGKESGNISDADDDAVSIITSQQKQFFGRGVKGALYAGEPSRKWQLSQTDYSSSLSTTERKATEDNFAARKQDAANQGRTDFHDGNLFFISVDVKKLSNGAIEMQLTPSKYANVLAWQRKLTGGLHYPSGTACLIITGDNKLIVGSRDQTRKAGDPNYLVQFPCGFLDSEPQQTKALQAMHHSKKPISGFFIEEGERESREELLADLPLIKNSNYPRMLGFTVTSEANNTKAIVRNNFVLYRTTLTMSELTSLREANQPPHFAEMTTIEGVDIKDITNIMNNGCKVHFDGRDRNFAGELGSGIELMYHSIMKHCSTQSLEDNRLTTSDDEKRLASIPQSEDRGKHAQKQIKARNSDVAQRTR